jgi:hypothetical protein
VYDVDEVIVIGVAAVPKVVVVFVIGFEPTLTVMLEFVFANITAFAASPDNVTDVLPPVTWQAPTFALELSKKEIHTVDVDGDTVTV